MRGTNRLQCRQGQQEYCSQFFSCRHDCFHAVWTFLTGATAEGEDTSFLSSLSSRFDSVFIGRRKRSARSTSSFRYAPTFIFISLLSPDDILLSPKTVLPSPFLELPAPDSLLSPHSNNADSAFSKFRVPVECRIPHYSILLSLPSPDIYKSSVTVTLIRDGNFVIQILLTRTAFNGI